MPEEVQDIAGETADQKYARLYGDQGTATATTSQVAQPAVPQEWLDTMREMRQEIQGLREQVTPQPPPPPPENPDEWVERIKKGDFKGAREFLVAQTEKSLEGRFQQLLSNANAQTQVQIDTAAYRDSVRSRNPDLLEFEPYLEAPIQRRLSDAQAAGKIRNTLDYVKEYKSALDAEVANLRNLSLKFRASGKDEATRRQTDVVSASTLNPQQVASLTQPTEGEEPQVETTEQYFARRVEEGRRRRGLI